MIEFDPNLAEMTQRGATAGLILGAQSRLSAACVEEVLAKIDTTVANGRLTPELALAFVSEIAAFRRIVARTRQEVDRGRAAERRLQENGNG